MKAHYGKYIHNQKNNHHRTMGQYTLSNIMLLGGLGDRDCVEYLPMVVREFYPHTHGKRALDLGAGRGVSALAMAEMGFHVAAVDMYRPLVSVVQKLATHQSLDISFAKGGIGYVEQAGIHYDLIHDHECLTMLTKSQDRQKFLATVRNALTVNGKFVLKTMALAPHYDPMDSFESIRMDENHVIWRQTPSLDAEGAVEYDGKFWTPQKRLAPCEEIRRELLEAGFLILREEIEVPPGNHPATFRLILASAPGR